MAIMGFCPGTAIGALADGARDMRYGMLGMVAGAFLYAEAAPFFAQHLKQETDMTKLTLVDATGWSAIVFATAFLSMVAAMKFFLDRKKSQKSMILRSFFRWFAPAVNSRAQST